jgi:ABC-2 type transport system ATP-binding protein
MSLAVLEGVSHSYGEHRALAGVNLAIEPGQVFGLLGPNGAGKTTAVRILCGLLVPDEGRAVIDGLDLAVEPLAARRRYGYVPDGAPLYAHLSARQHLELVGRLHGLDEPALRAETDRLLAALELDDRADDPIGGFSRGMRQKAAVACALLPKPALLVLDEPLSGLDAPTTAMMKEVLRGWADRGGAVLYTSHLLDVVERVCDRMAILDHGAVVAEGDLDELRARADEEGSLERVFGALTHAEEPSARAARVLGP